MILDGKLVAQKIYERLEKEIGGLKNKNIQPFLAVILVGEDPASLLYVRKKEERVKQLGIGFKLYHFPAIASESEVLELIGKLNQDNKIHGIVVQLPLPKNFNTAKILKSIDPKKDIENVSPAASAILEILHHYNIDFENKKIVLVGHGKLVGQPLHKMLAARAISPLVCDANTYNLKPITLSADIIISGVGEPGLIKADMISEKTIIIDAGTAESSGKTAGDVSPAAYKIAKSYSPVPGGVGPVTVACLFKNLIEAAKSQNE